MKFSVFYFLSALSMRPFVRSFVDQTLPFFIVHAAKSRRVNGYLHYFVKAESFKNTSLGKSVWGICRKMAVNNNDAVELANLSHRNDKNISAC
jgi:hypothetical protein